MEKLKKFVEGRVFQTIILVVIIINSIVLGLQTSKPINEAIGGILTAIDTACLVVFIIEMLLK